MEGLTKKGAAIQGSQPKGCTDIHDIHNIGFCTSIAENEVESQKNIKHGS